MNTIEFIKKKLKSKEYNFLYNDAHLNKNIMILTVGGSYAYGTNIEKSLLRLTNLLDNKAQT